MKRTIVTSIVLATAAATAGAYYHNRDRAGVTVDTAPVTRGAIVQTVNATGTLEAVQTVAVGTQVSGIVQELYADYNSIVRKGQLLARLDPSTIETQLAQAQAGLDKARADVERLEVNVEDARATLARSEALAAKRLIPEADLETARVAVRSAEVQVRSAGAQVKQVEASVTQNEVSLRHTNIYSPIDGIVVSRNVDVGQTVAASLSAPTLFSIAADLAEMQVKASVDEADVGLLRQGQAVEFRVDAYPQEAFSGTVSQVRLQAVTTQNVVTYTTVIDVPNPSLKLLPGMTASVTIEIARRDEAMRVPNAALRFRPTAAVLEAIGQALPAGAGGSQTGQTARAGGNAGPQSGGQAGRPAGGAAAAKGSRVWIWTEGRLEAVPVQVGISDGAYTELVTELPESATQLVTAITVGSGDKAVTTSTARSTTFSQGMGAMPPPPPPGM